MATDETADLLTGLRVVRGNPDPAELAAVVAVLGACAHRAASCDGDTGEASTPATWSWPAPPVPQSWQAAA